MTREFETGATRDTANWKLQTSKYSHPLCDYSFNTYMLSKQFINWTWREWDNWIKWLWKESLFESFCRHVENLKLLYAWYRVYEIKKDWVVSIIVSKDNVENTWYDFFEEKTFEMELNACRFNSEWLKLYFLWYYDN